jgi:hypothetical protein
MELIMDEVDRILEGLRKANTNKDNMELYLIRYRNVMAKIVKSQWDTDTLALHEKARRYLSKAIALGYDPAQDSALYWSV